MTVSIRKIFRNIIKSKLLFGTKIWLNIINCENQTKNVTTKTSRLLGVVLSLLR